MITNPVYYGAACWGKTTSSRILAYENGTQIPRGIRHFMRPTEKSNWQINENAGIPAIVSKELWEKANSMCLVEQRPRGKASSSQYLLSGLIFDEATGSAMVGSNGGHYKRKDCTVLKKRYYVNNNWHSQGVAKGVKSVDAERLEVKIIEQIRENILDGKIAACLESILGEHVNKNTSTSSKEGMVRNLDQQIFEKQKAIKNLMKAIQTAPDVEALIPALRTAESEKKLLEVRKAEALKSPECTQKLQKKEIDQIVAGFLLNFREVFSRSTPPERKSILRQWIERIDIFNNSGIKKARARIRLFPRTADFEHLLAETVLSGPCRTPYSGDITQNDTHPFVEEVEFCL
jgi:hypothetical protein